MRQGSIEFSHVSKRYHLGSLGTLRGLIADLVARQPHDNGAKRTFWALRDVCFQVESGASLGLIGPNGAGKTTTLRLLSNITQPTSGHIRVSGRLSALIELGAGFHPELSGRDNIFLNGAILGLNRREIQRKLEAIIAFSELERFIDTPVKRYSSGMYVRLGFAVAAHVEPDVLLVDEVLAVGDASFRNRCIQRMRELRANGTTILFVSHNMHLVRDMCENALLLQHGHIAGYGDTSSVIAEYERLVIADAETHRGDAVGLADSALHSDTLILSSVDILPSEPGAALRSDRPLQIRIGYRSRGPQPIGRIDLRILRQDGALCCAVDSVGVSGLRELADAGVIEATLTPLQLTGGSYYVVIRITDPSDSVVLASAQSHPFAVVSSHMVPEPGIFLPHMSWHKRS